MRTLKHLILFCLALSLFSMTDAQNLPHRNASLPSTLKLENGTAKGPGIALNCPSGSVFSNPPVNSDGGWTSHPDIGYLVYQSFSGVSGSFNTITFWMLFSDTPPPTFNFLVEVYGSGSTPGAVQSSQVLSLNAVNTGENIYGLYDIYQFTATIPALNLPAGWVSVQALPGEPVTSYWLNSIPGIGQALQWDGFAFTDRGSVAMCLGTSESVPVSDWAIGFGLLLITFFLFIIYRRRVRPGIN
jgi:hypothetical protein